MIDFGDPTTNEGCLSGHYWSGGVCSRCGERLRCACGRFVTIDGLDDHIDTDCPLGATVVAPENPSPLDSENRRSS